MYYYYYVCSSSSSSSTVVRYTSNTLCGHAFKMVDGAIERTKETRKEFYISKLTKLKEELRDDVKMRPGKANSLRQLEGYRQGTIKWNDAESRDFVKEFLKDITGLEMSLLRSTRPLLMEVYDQNYEVVNPVDIRRVSDFPFEAGQKFFVKIRRMRNAPLDSFRLLLGPGIGTPNLSLAGLETQELGIHQESGGTLWKIFVGKGELQNGLWAEFDVVSPEKNCWLEVFDHGSNVEQSGTRLQIVSLESI